MDGPAVAASRGLGPVSGAMEAGRRNALGATAGRGVPRADVAPGPAGEGASIKALSTGEIATSPGGGGETSANDAGGEDGRSPGAGSTPAVTESSPGTARQARFEIQPSTSAAAAVERAQSATHDWPRATGRSLEFTAPTSGDSRVDVRASLHGGAVRAELGASDAVTHGALVKNIDGMQQQLERAGIAVSSLNVHLDASAHRRSSGRNRREEEETVVTSSAPARRTAARSVSQLTTGEVDYVA